MRFQTITQDSAPTENPLSPSQMHSRPKLMTHGHASITSEDTLGLRNVNKLPGPQFTNRDARENAALACKIYIMQICAIPATLHSLSTASFPSFPPQSLPGASFPQSSAFASMLRPPLPGTPPPVPRGGFASLTVAARRLLRWHGWTHTREHGPRLKNLPRRTLYPHSRC